jgi:hypothetical protein
MNALDAGGDERNADTPIRLAVRLGRWEMFKRLWNEGAKREKYSIEVPTYMRRSMAEIASHEGHVEILKYMFEWSDEWTQEQRASALCMACSMWHGDVVEGLLDRCEFSFKELDCGIEAVATTIVIVGEHHRSPMERLRTLEEDSAIQAKIVGMLLEARVGCRDATTTNDEAAVLNRTLFQVSYSPFTIATMRLVLARGADPNARSATDGRIPLQYAVVKRRDIQRCNTEGIALLRKYGARPDVASKYGETAMEIAKRHGSGMWQQN